MDGLAKLSRSFDMVPTEKIQEIIKAFRMSELEPQPADEHLFEQMQHYTRAKPKTTAILTITHVLMQLTIKLKEGEKSMTVTMEDSEIQKPAVDRIIDCLQLIDVLCMNDQ